MSFRLAIFASGNGSNAQALIDTFGTDAKSLLSVQLIITDNPNAGVILRAEKHRIPVIILAKTQRNDAEYINNILESHSINFIVLAGYLKKIPTGVINHFTKRIINLHPSLLPKYGGKGMYGHRVHDAVIANGETESGITIHYVDAEYDTGAVIYQQRITIPPNCTPTELQKAIHKLEHQALPKVVEDLCKRLHNQNL